MPNIKLPDGNEISFNKPVNGLEKINKLNANNKIT